MQVLEKILQEIEKESYSTNTDYGHSVVVNMDSVAKIIRFHVGDDGWIPVTWHETTEEDGIDMVRYPVCLDCPMPEDDQEILISTRNGWVRQDTCYILDGYSLDSGNDWVDDVLAWQPLPKPYRPDKCTECFGAAENACERCRK